MTSTSSRNKKIVFAAGGATITAMLMAILISGNLVTSASATATVIEDRPLSESVKIIKIKDISVARESSVNPDVKFSAKQTASGIAFMAANSGDEEVDVAVERWEARISGELFSDPVPVKMDKSLSLAGKTSSVVAEVDLSEYDKLFEAFPGTYNLELVGWNWYEKDFGTHTKLGNWEDYVFSVDITIDYDIAQIEASTNRLLKADGMLVAVEGEGNLYSLGDDSTKKISFYLINEGNADLSAVLGGSQLTIWHSDSRYPAVAMREIRESYSTACEALKPGERKLVGSYEISKSGWPIGADDGIADQMGSKIPLPGLYIAHMEAGTVTCTTSDGQEALGDSFSAILALEVEP